MKTEKKHVEATAWSQLTDRIREADRTKKQNNMLLQEQLDYILKGKDLKINLPKNLSILDNKLKPC